ncbi:uncharacterized protein BX663DRAFT_489829 [Cokeromyces recurvatus]|uniref:uncharacterized protein n=1 Tax=Cokeromyces recurvatus TaxID=90255 RepID=UPI002220DE5C|nr:uncharacterized protein BX663DRAFT_489829 [Cokeromyces recurvatus]KAI7898722.1 hypothetical protein BX663DRAFT_489829 [Cokeromyces recurvatus]
MPLVSIIKNKSTLRKKMTEAVHHKGAVIFCQLWSIGRTDFRKLNPINELIISASAIPIKGQCALLGGVDYEVPYALEIDEIKAVIEDYRFDDVEIHAGFDYLIAQVMNSSSKIIRTDEYGCSIQVLHLQWVKNKVIFEFSPVVSFQDMHDDTPFETWGYLISQL